MVKRVQIRPRTREEGIPAEPGTPETTVQPPDGFKIKVRRKRNEGAKSPASPPLPPASTSGDRGEALEKQALELANQLLGDTTSGDASNGNRKHGNRAFPTPSEEKPKKESSGELQVRRKSRGEDEQPKKKKRKKLSFSLNIPQLDIVSALCLFLIGNILLAFAMFGIGNPLEKFTSVSLIGICASQCVFTLFILAPIRVLEAFARTLVGAFTLFTSLAAVGVFLTEAFLVPNLGLGLIQNMPSAPLAGSATFIFSACLILVARRPAPNWSMALLCILFACIIPVLPVSHFFTMYVFSHPLF